MRYWKQITSIVLALSVILFFNPFFAKAAVSITNLTSGQDIDGGSGSVTASVSPTSNALQLLQINSKTGISVDPNQPTVTGNGLTWVAINSIVYDTTSSSRRRITLFRALGASPSSETIAIDFGGQNQTDVLWSLEEATGIDTSGTNGSGAIVQSATNKDETITTATLTVTLGAFSDINNATFGAFANYGSPTGVTAGAGFTLLGNIEDSLNALHSSDEWKTANDTGVDLTFDQNSQMGGIAIEIKTASTPATPPNGVKVIIQGGQKVIIQGGVKFIGN